MRIWFTAGLLLLLGGVMQAEAQVSSQQRPGLPLELLPDTFALCRLPPAAAIPAWASAPGSFLTISRTPDELSITVVQSAAPSTARCERDYRAVRVRGTLSPDLVGILVSIAEPLARAGLGILAISTYDTDYVFVRARDLAAALQALREAGHQVRAQDPNPTR